MGNISFLGEKHFVSYYETQSFKRLKLKFPIDETMVSHKETFSFPARN